MELSSRQKRIIEIVKDNSPIKGEDLAARMGIARATLRADLTVLTKVGILGAKPHVGYFFAGARPPVYGPRIEETMPIADFMTPAATAAPSMSVYDAIVEMFARDTGSLMVCDGQELLGIVSRKDLLKVSISQGELVHIPLSLIMTRMPNIITVTPKDSLLSAAQKLQSHKIDTVPVVHVDENGVVALVGKVSKTTILNTFVKIFA